MEMPRASARATAAERTGCEGWHVNHKKIQRLWREEGLRVPQRRRRKRLGTTTTPNLPVADAPNGTPQRATDLQLLGRDPSDIPTLAEAERVLILRALEAADGHKGKVCQILGISRPTLERKLHKHGISRGEQRSDKGA